MTLVAWAATFVFAGFGGWALGRGAEREKLAAALTGYGSLFVLVCDLIAIVLGSKAVGATTTSRARRVGIAVIALGILGVVAASGLLALSLVLHFFASVDSGSNGCGGFTGHEVAQ